MSSQGVYLYSFALSGALPDGCSIGKDSGREVSIKRIKDVAALCSRVSLGEFTGETGELNMKNPAWLIPQACRHEKVVEEAMKYSPVVPLRFATVFSSMQALEEFITPWHEEISRGLEYVSGKEEWCVKVFAHVGRIVERLLAADPLLARQRDCLSDSPGARYFQEKQLHREAEKQANCLCRSVAERFALELKRVSVELRFLNLRNENQQEGGGRMVLNCALFLSRARVDDFHARVEEISATYGAGEVVQETSGPWPPYNFCPSIQSVPNPL